MNPISKNTQKLTKNLDLKTKKSKKKILFNPPLKKVETKKGIHYKIKCRKDYSNISLTHDQRIFVCIYQINKTGFKPFLQYTLWKYKNNDLMIFPFLKPNNKAPLLLAQEIIKKTNKENAMLKGYKLNNNGVFFFFEDSLSKNKLNFTYRSKNKWWVTIDEICNHRNVLKFPIHPSVTSLFFQNPDLIYLYKNLHTTFEIPTVVYRGNAGVIIPMEIILGVRNLRSAFLGPFYYFKNYNGAMRYTGWTSNYKPFIINGKCLTNQEGKWKIGGIIRYVLFLGKSKILTDDKDIYDYGGIWSEHYNSVYIGRIRLKNGYVFRSNPSFIVKQAKQCIPLSMHFTDNKTFKRTWDPIYNNYYIQ